MAHTAIASPCGFDAPVVGALVEHLTGGVCAAAGSAVGGAVGGLVSEAASAVGGGVLDLLSRWIIGAATHVTTLVSRAMAQTTTPALESSWFQAQFIPMADLGAALGLLVALIALSSAAIPSPQALAATLAAIGRAGLGTGLIVAFAVTGLSLADQVSADVVSRSPHAFWATVAHAWGDEGFGGFGSSALAMLIALIEVFAAVFVWLELIVRAAAIYVAVLFFPASLAAAIWPALSAWPARLGRLLLLFVILKPVALIILSLAGNAAAAGLSLQGGVPGSVGEILAATVIYALAAFAPWALMHLLAADAESAHTASGLRAAGADAALGSEGRSLRNVGGLRDASLRGGSFGGPNGSGPGRGPGGSGGAGGGPSGGGPRAGGGGGGAAQSEDTLPVSAATVGAGSVGAAAGVGARAGSRAERAAHGSGSSADPNRPAEQSRAAGGEDQSISRLDAPARGGRVVQLQIRERAFGGEEPRRPSAPARDPGAPPETRPRAGGPAPPSRGKEPERRS